MPTVRVDCPSPLAEVIARQLPPGGQQWHGFHFDLTGEVENPDFWVILNDLTAPARRVCARSRTMLICGEPSAIHPYHPRFTAQFGTVLTCQAGLKHPRVILHHPALAWWAGIEMISPADWRVRADYQALRSMVFPPKADRISVVNSGKVMVPGHQARNDFIAALSKHFGGRLEVFGHGYRRVPDKLDAIAPFKYHIAIENSVEPHYWSEKLADAFLGGAMPFYSGCPNIADYFPEGSLYKLDIRDPSGAICMIEQAIQDDAFTQTAVARAVARLRVLDEHNLFSVLCRHLPSLPDGPRSRMTIRPHDDLSKPLPGRIKRRARRVLERIGAAGAGLTKDRPHKGVA